MNKNNTPQRKRSNFLVFALIIAIGIGIFYFFTDLTTASTYELNSTQFEIHFEAGEIDTIYTKPYTDSQYYVTGTITIGEEESYYNVYLFDFEIEIYRQLISESTPDSLYSHTTLEAGIVETNYLMLFIVNVLPYVIMIVIFFFIFRNIGGSNNKAMDFGKNRAQLSRDKSKTFKDVAGCDEEKEELVEIIDFLKHPKKYSDMGARIPKGVLLVGPPGTGKTLIAKAVAGEASVPFFSISGSDFVEMFVGVGASRVRDLFKTAKENAPCIIFIDEIDAVGRQRGAGMGGGNDEREQTLNQLLVEMDGFNGQSGIIMIAATNRPDVLDPALLRPGRFDRQVTISAPDVKGRVAVLKVHARNKKLNPSIEFEDIAQRIPGFSGADIENLLNESALLAARDNRKIIELTDIDEAVDRVMMGPAKKSKKFTEKERKMIAHHEAGHAVIGLKLENSNVVQKVTIVPRGNAGGYALMMPEEETFLETKTSLLDRITGYLGGRVAEELIFGEVTTGAHNDFQQATKIARAMVTEYGMSSLGPVQYEGNTGSVFLGRDYGKEKNFSNQLAHDIDLEVRKIIDECYAIAKKTLEDNKQLLLNIADYLLKIETLTKQDILEIDATGKLKWYAEKLVKDQEEKERKALEAKAASERAIEDAKRLEQEALDAKAEIEAQKLEDEKEEFVNESAPRHSIEDEENE
ncbi:MAG: ATP-dependent zinc metalloprotease FtsH [bacterium]